MPKPSAPAQSVTTPNPPAPSAPAAKATPTATTPAMAGRPPTVPNARKGYKLTLWVSATSEAGLADVHGLLQLDGADPSPFCRVKAVANPLARALQEAYVAVERARAKPPRMAAPTPSPISQSPTEAPHPVGPPARPPYVSAPAAPAAPTRTLAAVAAGPQATEPVAQPSLF